VLCEVERRKLEQALKEAGGNRGRAADLLRIGPKVLQQKMKDYALDS
jgi:DNA-binding NtrC family response regulator